MLELDDISLLHEYAERHSEEAFAVLVERHINKVYSVALRHTRNPHSAEEITQAVFVILARKAGHLGKNVILEGWLYETARLTAITFIRSEIRRARREQEAHMQTTLNQNETDAWTQIAPELDAALARLNPTDRNAIVLRFFYDKRLSDIGAALGASEEGARKRVNRALEKLQKHFLKCGVSSTAETIAQTISANSVQAAPVALAKAVTAIALAKGATASLSTSTLTKGALKLMAWTKIKTALVATVAVILTAGPTTLVVEMIHMSRIADDNLKVTARVRALKMEDLRAEDCTPEFWQQLQQSRQSEHPDMAKVAAAMGELRTVTLVERTKDRGRPSYLFRMEYQNMDVLFRIVFDGNKIAYAKGSPAPN